MQYWLERNQVCNSRKQLCCWALEHNFGPHSSIHPPTETLNYYRVQIVHPSSDHSNVNAQAFLSRSPDATEAPMVASIDLITTSI
jgi:hypothetical protein